MKTCFDDTCDVVRKTFICTTAKEAMAGFGGGLVLHPSLTRYVPLASLTPMSYTPPVAIFPAKNQLKRRVPFPSLG